MTAADRLADVRLNREGTCCCYPGCPINMSCHVDCQVRRKGPFCCLRFQIWKSVILPMGSGWRNGQRMDFPILSASVSYCRIRKSGYGLISLLR